MPGNQPRIEEWVCFEQRFDHARQLDILGVRIWHLVLSLDFDSDRKIIAAGASPKTGGAGMPRAPPKRHELDQCAITPYEKMGGNLQVRDLLEVGMCRVIDTVGEEILDVRPAEAARREADAMDYDEFGLRITRSVVLVGRRALRRRPNEPHPRADGIAMSPSLGQLTHPCFRKTAPEARQDIIVFAHRASCQRRDAQFANASGLICPKGR